MERGVNRMTVCYNCTDRCIGCHATCSKYIEAKAEYNKLQEKVKKSRLINAGIVCTRINRYKGRVAHYKQKEV